MGSSPRRFGNSHRGLFVVFKPATQRSRMSTSSSQDRPVSEQRESEQCIVVPTQQARQGVPGHNVRYVLGIGVAAVIVAFVVLYAIYFA
jgi:hypothetical protein